MAEPIGSLNVKLGLDSAQFTTGLKKSQTDLTGFAKSAGLAGAALGAVFAGVGIAMTGAIKGAIDNADELSKAAQKVGTSVEELSRLKYAAELSDVSLEGLTGGMKRLSASMAEVASKGTGKAADAFAALGISVTDASGELKDGSEVLTEVAGKFGEMSDGAAKTSLAMAIFGKSGADLIPLLNSGAGGLAEMRAEAEALGLVIDTKTAKSAEAFNDNLTRLKLVGSGLSTQLAAGVLPALESVSTALVGTAKNTAAMDVVGRVLSGTIRVLASAAVAAGGVFAYLGTIVGGVAQGLGLAVKGQFKEAMGALDGAAVRAETISKASGDAIRAIWSKGNLPSKQQTEETSDKLAAPIVRGGEKIKAAADKAAKEVAAAKDKLREAADRVVEGLMSADEKYAKDFADNRKALLDAMAADVGNRERYYDALERLEIEREARGFKPVKTPGNVDFEPGIPQSPEFTTKLDDLIGRLDDARRAADEVAYSVDDIFYGLKNRDWGMAVSGLLRAAKSIQTAFTSGTKADQYAALGGLAQGVGGAIGGKAGGFLAGAGSGAATGAAIGSAFPVIGTAVGAVVGGLIGGISSLFGGSSKKKAARREAEERARQAEAERVARVEAARKTLEIQLMELSGDKAGALARQREYELAAMDASLHAQQKAVWAAEDLAEAQAKLAAVSATRRDLEIQLMEAMGDSAGAIAAQRAEYLKGLDESLRPLQSAVWGMIDANDALARSQDAVAAAQDVVREAYDRDAAVYRDTIERFKGIAASLRGYAASIGAAEDGTNSLAEAARNFAKVSAAARLGDEAAMGGLEAAGEAYRSAGKSQARNLLEQLRIDAQVRTAVEAAAATAERQASIAEQQLNALTNTLPAGLAKLDLTFSESMAALNETLKVQAELQAVANAQMAEAVKFNQASQAAALQAAITAGLNEIAKNTKSSADTLTFVTRGGTEMIVAA